MQQKNIEVHSNIKPVYIKVIGDALLPLLGYFFWDWSIYFILLFYVLDLVVGEVLVHLKTKKIKAYSEKVIVKDWIKQGVISLVLVLIILFGMHLAMKIVAPTIDFLLEIKLFLSYEEIGVAQGYILLPLIVFMGYSQFRNEFIIPKQFRVLEFSSLWKKHVMSRLLICVLIVFLSIVAYFLQPTGWFYVFTIVIATSSYQLLMERNN